MESDLTQVKSTQDSLTKAIGKGAVNCVIALLAFFLSDPLLASTIITFLQTLQAEIALQKAGAEALLAQSTVALAFIDTEIQSLGALTSVADGLGNRFPLDKLMGCPAVAIIVNGVTGAGTSKFSQNISSALSTASSKVNKVKTFIRDLQYKEALLKQKINQINQDIQQLDLFNSQLQAMINFFQAISTFPGKLPPLPLP